MKWGRDFHVPTLGHRVAKAAPTLIYVAAENP
jgi:hypothetical protein